MQREMNTMNLEKLKQAATIENFGLIYCYSLMGLSIFFMFLFSAAEKSVSPIWFLYIVAAWLGLSTIKLEVAAAEERKNLRCFVSDLESTEKLFLIRLHAKIITLMGFISFFAIVHDLVMSGFVALFGMSLFLKNKLDRIEARIE